MPCTFDLGSTCNSGSQGMNNNNVNNNNNTVPEPPRLTSRMSSRTINDAHTGHPLCSEFGLRSLHRTAQSVGLTLDQLALVLSSTENLAAKLGMDQDEQQVGI